MTDTELTGGEDRKAQARALLDQAGHTIRAEAQSFAEVAQDRVRAEAQKGAQAAGQTLGDFANAIRRAGDELDRAEQTPASRLVRQAAEGLEGISRGLAEKEPGELLDAVRDFGRRNPAAFIGGAVLLGLALGRLARASDARTSEMGAGGDMSAGAPMLREREVELAERDAYDGAPEYVGAEAGLEPAITEELDADLSATPATDPGPMGKV